ncbi:MAG: dihydroneopterin aldolase [Chitinophagaceae bacterium]|nr:dihydroneopterin aldolase [Chitinophagaceae bacterium]
MIKIALHQLKFHAYHGLYKEERTAGNDFEINLTVSFDEPSSRITKLEDTINYAQLYELVKDRMAIPEPLLETLVMDIARQIKEKFARVREIDISIRKMKIPLINFLGEASVSFHKQYDVIT